MFKKILLFSLVSFLSVSSIFADPPSRDIGTRLLDGDRQHAGIASNPFSVDFGDAATADAFGRLRISGIGQRLDVEFIYGKQNDFFDEITSNGTVTFNGGTRDLTLSLSDAVDGSHATMRSHPVPYTPGNSQLIGITGVLDLAGIGGGTAEVFLRTKISGTVAETTITQANWDNATSGVDWTTSHIFSIDFQSLKVGRIRFNMVRSGLAVNVAEMLNDNTRDSGYWQLASLPAYWRLYNDASDTYMEVGYGNEDNAVGFRYKITANANATMKAICCTVKSEGGLALKDMVGLPRSIDNGVTEVTVSTTLIPLLSIRPKTTFLTYDNLILTLPKSFTITTDNPIRVVIMHDVTLTGASWVDVDAVESSIEYDITASAITNGHVVFSDYITTAAKNRSNTGQGLLGKTVLWNRQSSRTGILTIAAIRTGGTDGSCLSALQWEEIR